MNRLERTLLAEVGGALLGGFTVVVLLLLGGALFEVLAPLLSRGVETRVVAQFLALRLPEVLVRGIPIAYLFALLLVLSRMAQDSELKVLLAAGIPRSRVLAPLLTLGLFLALFGFIAGETWVPSSNRQANNVLQKAALDQPQSLLRPGTVFSDSGGRKVYVGQVDQTGLGELRVISREEVLVAGRGEFQDGQITTGPGSRVTYGRDQPRTVTRFSRATVPLSGDLSSGLDPGLSGMTLNQLRERIERYSERGLPYAAELTTYYRKWSEPIASVVFAFFAVALAFFMLRGGQGLGLVGIVVLTFVYYSTWSVFRIMGEQGVVPAWVGAFTPVGIFALAGLVIWGLGKR